MLDFGAFVDVNGPSHVQSRSFNVAQSVITREVAAVFRWQIRLTVVAMLLCSIFSSEPRLAALSALCGGLISIVPALLYAKLAYSRRRAAPEVLLKAHFRAEAAKLFATVALFAVLMIFFKDISALALFLGFVLAQSAYWISLLSNKSGTGYGR